MYLPLTARSTTLTEEQARLLDDEFFLSNPLGFFSSRIASLLAAEDSAARATPADFPEFFDVLGLEEPEHLLDFAAEERRVQTAIDALALRHQAAEALIRFLYALAAADPRNGDAPCVWLAIADSPTPMIQVLEHTKAAFDADPYAFINRFLPVGTEVDTKAATATETAFAWANHAVELLSGDELSINAAHNKVKHGLAISARGDVRIDFITTPPDADGNIPLSAFGEENSFTIFDRPVLTYLSRPRATPRQGIEAVSLRVDLPVVLAESWMMANVYAALFHVAARKHFQNDLPERVAPYPTLVVDRTPEHVIGARPLGFRSAVTLPPDGTSAPRPSGIFFHQRFMPTQIDFESRIDGRVVAD